jgi:hypothetical protein
MCDTCHYRGSVAHGRCGGDGCGKCGWTGNEKCPTCKGKGVVKV